MPSCSMLMSSPATWSALPRRTRTTRPSGDRWPRFAHEISQNNLAVVFFSGMLPQQLLANTDVLDYFEPISFLCLRCDGEVLRTRFMRRGDSGSDTQRIEAAVDQWSRFNDVLMDAANSSNDVHAIDATRSVGEVEIDVREWVLARLKSWS